MAEPLGLVVSAVPPSHREAQAVLTDYFGELVSRYQGRPGTPQEVRGAMLDDPSDDLRSPTGVLLLAYRAGQPVGCIGLRFRSIRVGQVTRMFVLEQERRQGVGMALLAQVEAIAREHAITRLELDTRDDLVEARRLYVRFGFEEVPAFNSGPYAEHWFAKSLM